VGGGLKRSNGGVWPSNKDIECYDSRVLGSGYFVENLSKLEEKKDQKTIQLKNMGWDDFVSSIAKAQGVEMNYLYEKGCRRRVSDGKAMLIYAGITHFGKTIKELVQMTCMKEPPASRARERGRELLEKLKFLSQSN